MVYRNSSESLMATIFSPFPRRRFPAIYLVSSRRLYPGSSAVGIYPATSQEILLPHSADKNPSDQIHNVQI